MRRRGNADGSWQTAIRQGDNGAEETMARPWESRSKPHCGARLRSLSWKSRTWTSGMCGVRTEQSKWRRASRAEQVERRKRRNTCLILRGANKWRGNDGLASSRQGKGKNPESLRERSRRHDRKQLCSQGMQLEIQKQLLRGLVARQNFGVQYVDDLGVEEIRLKQKTNIAFRTAPGFHGRVSPIPVRFARDKELQKVHEISYLTVCLA